MTTAAQLVDELRENGLTCATAESCTGGGVGRAITSVPGASAVFPGGIICYDNRIKRDVLGVDGEMLEKDGPVSPRCAAQMALGARKLMAADFAVSVTGLAGPGGDGINPQGCVWFAVASARGVETGNVVFPGDREEVRSAAVEHALRILLDAVHGRE